MVRYDAEAGERSLDLLRWGLVPRWAKDIKVGFANINAKAEGIEKKPAFREPFQQRRCLVPGRRSTAASSLMRSGSRAAARWRWQHYGKPGAPLFRRTNEQLGDRHHGAQRSLRGTA